MKYVSIHILQLWKHVRVVKSASCKVKSWGSGQSDVTPEPAQSTAITGVRCTLRNAISSHSSFKTSHKLECSSSFSHWFVGIALITALLAQGVCTSKVGMLSSLHAHPVCQEEGRMENWTWEKQLPGLKEPRLRRVFTLFEDHVCSYIEDR